MKVLTPVPGAPTGTTTFGTAIGTLMPVSPASIKLKSLNSVHGAIG